MIFFGQFGFRYLELAIIGALLVSCGLLFLKKRPRGLVWLGAAWMLLVLAHLLLEQGRWQLVPAYLLLLSFSFWLAIPRERAVRRLGIAVRVGIIVVLVLPGLALPVVAPLFYVGDPSGPLPVGTAVLYPQTASRGVRVYYPAAMRTPLVSPYWSEAEISDYRLPGYPRILASHLALIPTPAYVRAPVAPGTLPLLLILPGREGLPGDYLHLALDAASAGWFVARLPGEAAPEQIVAAIEQLTKDELDLAVAGKIDSTRVVLLIGAHAETPDLGFASITIDDGAAAHAVGPAGGLELALPKASVPVAALTYRHRIVEPATLLVGSSDVPPEAVERVMRRFFSLVLGDGSLSAPIFSGAYPSSREILEAAPFATTHYGADERTR
ncbi:MAG: hypothetical protein ACLFP4_17160 [Spirochaetales bacterium]